MQGDDYDIIAPAIILVERSQGGKIPAYRSSIPGVVGMRGVVGTRVQWLWHAVSSPPPPGCYKEGLTLSTKNAVLRKKSASMSCAVEDSP